MSEEILLTQEGYDKIVAEHEELVSVKRKEVSERLKKPSHTETFRRTPNMTLRKMSRQSLKREYSSLRI